MGRDLRTLFASNDVGLESGEAFTNRQAQWDVAAHTLAEHLGRIAAPGFDVQDLEVGRHNVLVFHGVGGIGKTVLSRKLEDSLGRGGRRPPQWGAPVWPTDHRILPVRIDLSRSAGVDFEGVVLAVRLALAAVGRPMPAFDIALRRYWEAQHPGEAIEDYLKRRGLAGRLTQALPGQVEGALSEVAQALLLPGMVGSAVGTVTTALVRGIRERRQTVRSLAGCWRLADLLESEPDLDSLSYYPHLLAWEISRLPPRKAVTPVVLLDTFEDVGDRTHRDLEQLLQRVVWLMPNALFIVTGRNRLQWADPVLAGQLDYTGPDAWPQLAHHLAPRTATTDAAPGPGRQILIGDFSPEDCDDYLARRLTVAGRPLIDPRIRRVITTRSHGLPLFLDLAVMRFLEIRRSGRTPAPEDFAVDFPSLIARTLADLTPDERQVLRSAALLDAWDVPLATAAAGLTHQAAARRMAERPFVIESPSALWPYHLHAVIRSSVRAADDQTDDRWTPEDWHAAAVRAHTALGDQWRGAPTGDRTLLIGCLRQGLRLAREFRLDLGWLTEAAWQYVSDFVWEPVAPPIDPAPDADDAPVVAPVAADALIDLLSALARRQHEHRTRTVDRLTAVIDTSLLPPDLTDMAVYYRAKAQRDLGRAAESADGMRTVAAGSTPLAPDAARGLAHLARLAGDFTTALDLARTLGWDGRGHRVEGDVLWPQGRLAQAADAYAAARDEAERHGATGERAVAQAHRALTVAFADPRRASDEVDLARQYLTGLDLRATRLTVDIAELLGDIETLSEEDFDRRAEDLRGEIRPAGLAAALEPTLTLVEAFRHAVHDDEALLADAIRRLTDLTCRGDYAYYVDIAAFAGGRPIPHPSTARWLDGPATTRTRWRALAVDRQRHLPGRI